MFANYNKEIKGVLIGNWQEETAIQHCSSFHERLITHSASVEPKDYKSTSHEAHATGGEFGPKTMGLREKLYNEEDRALVDAEIQARLAQEAKLKRMGSYETAGTFPRYDERVYSDNLMNTHAKKK